MIFRFVLFDTAARGNAVERCEYFGKLQGIGKAAQVGGLADRGRALLKERDGVFDTLLRYVAGERDRHFFSKQLRQIVGVKVERFGGARYGERRVGKTFMHVVEYALDMRRCRGVSR